MAQSARDDSNASKGVLILTPATWELEDTADTDVMSWADAQLTGQLRFSRYDAFICFPPEYPATDREPDRDRMWERLRRRLEQGALAVFMYPSWRDDRGDGPCERWQHAIHLLRSVTGAVLSPLQDLGALKFTVSDDCPVQLAKWLNSTESDSVLEVGRGPRPRVISRDSTVVVAGFEVPAELPVSVAGFLPCGGAWLAVPWADEQDDSASVRAILGELGDLRFIRAVPGFQRLSPGLRRVCQALAAALPGFVPAHVVEATYRGKGTSTAKATTIASDLRRAGVTVTSAPTAREQGHPVPEDAKGYRLG